MELFHTSLFMMLNRSINNLVELTWTLEMNGGKYCVEVDIMLFMADLMSDVTPIASLSGNFSSI